MSLRREAEEEAIRFFDDVARGLIRDAIEFRRKNPCYFGRVRRIMARKLRERGASKARIRWNEFWAEKWEARCEALEPRLAKVCVCKGNSV